jgi:ABC-2 type transport system ATP-binding protein
VAIIDQGKIKAEGTRRELVNLVGQKDRVTIVAGGGQLHEAAQRLAALEGVEEAGADDHGITLLVTEASGRLATILGLLAESGISVSGVTVEEPDLEAVFLHLTGKALRDV